MSNGRIDPGPEPYSHEWYRVQFRGLTHLLNRQANEALDQYNALQDLIARVKLLEAAREADMAAIGRLNERLDEAGKIVRELREKAVAT